MKVSLTALFMVVSVGISAQANSRDCAQKIADWGVAKIAEGMQIDKIKTGRDLLKSLELPTGGTQADRLYVEGVRVGVFPMVLNSQSRIENAEVILEKQQIQNAEIFEQLVRECVSK